MRIIILILIFFSWIENNPLCAQNLLIGKVIAGDTKEQLAGARLFWEGSNLSSLSTETGEFSIEIPCHAQPKRLIVAYLGYKDDTLLWVANQTYHEFVLTEISANRIAPEVVVTGTLREVSRSESPISVEVYTAEFFKRNPSPSLFAMLDNINGVRPQLNCNVCNTGDIHINGMEGGYTMVLIDGMPIVSALSSVYGLNGIPNSLIERIEIVKGPASTLYGSEAVGGLINVITKNPLTAPKMYLDASLTSYLEANMDFSARFNLGKKVSSLLSANYYHFNTLWDINSDNFTDVTLQKRASVFNKWAFVRKNQRQAGLAVRYVWENRWGGELQWTPEFRGGDSLYGEQISTNRIELIGNYQLPTREKILLTYSYNYHHQNSAYGQILYNAKQQVGFAQLTWDKHLGLLDVLAGATMRYTYYDDNTLATTQPTQTYLPGLFLQNELTFSPMHKLLLGIRYDYNSQHGSILTPRLNYKLTFNPRHVLRLGVGNGYRVVNVFSEDHAALTGARQVVIKSGLLPERSWNGNLNYVGKFFPKFGFFGVDASLFYTRFSNKIVADYFTDPDKIIYDNLAGFGVSKGMTLNTDWNFKNGLKIMAGFTLMSVYTQTSNSKETQVQAPPFSGTWSVSYGLPKWGISFDYTGNVYSPMRLPILPDDFRPEYSPWFSIQNFQITKRFKKGVELYTGVKNLLNFLPKHPIMRPFDPFDKQIGVNNPYGYTFDPNYNYAPMQGIRGFLGVRWTFG